MIKRYRIHTPPYSNGQLVEDQFGELILAQELALQTDLGAALISVMRKRTEDALMVALIDELDRVITTIGGTHA